MKKKIMKNAAVLLPLVVALCLTVQCSLEPEQAKPGKNSAMDVAMENDGEHDWEDGWEHYLDKKMYWEGSVEEDFEGSNVLVVLDKNTGGINKEHDIAFFSGIEIEYIEDLTAIENDVNDTLLNVEQFRQILLIKLPADSKENVINVIRQLEQKDGVLWAGPDYAMYPDATNPNDPEYANGNQWALNGPFGIQAQNVWDITTGSSTVKVGIIDTGIAAHPDLNANVISGKKFFGTDNNTSDSDGHGSHIAGIVGSVTNNNTGIAGANWNVSLVPLKITNVGALISNRVIKAISYAADKKIKILNLSYSSSVLIENGFPLLVAIGNYNGLFVCTAGNKGKSNDTSNRLPANWNFLPHLISVGAIDSNGDRCSFSNWGKNTVDLFAPGDWILSTYPMNICDKGLSVCDPDGYEEHLYRGYHYMSGTSMAAPYVAATAALMLSVNPNLTPAQLKQKIMATVDKYSKIGNSCVSGGRLNAFNAVSSLLPLVSIQYIPGVTVPVTGAVPVTAITETDYCTGTVTWSPNHSVFQSATQYTATITMQAKPGYTFYGFPANFFRVTGATPVSNAANSGIVSAVFPVTETSVTETAIQGITPPVAGAVPSSTITETCQYTGTMHWLAAMGPDGTFADDTVYRAFITLTPKPGYTLQGVPPNSFTVAGAASIFHTPDYSVIIAHFPATANVFGGGSGAQYDPYWIQSLQHLKNLELPYHDTYNKNYLLKNDLSVYNGGHWVPIDSFQGTLDGGGKAIKMLSLSNYNNPETEYGLFRTNSGTIKNLTIEGYINVYSSGTSTVTFGNFACTNYGTIAYCHSGNSVFSANMVNCNNGNSQIGGIAGINSGYIYCCTNNGDFYTTGISGGIVGNNWGTVEECVNNGTIDCWASFWQRGNDFYKAVMGGIVGEINMGTVTNCENTGLIIFTEGYSDYITILQPHASQIIGRGYTYYSPTYSNNACSGIVDQGNLHVVTWMENGVPQYFNQAAYVSPYGEIGCLIYVPW